MSLQAKVLWSEGLCVGPQHLQQLDLYHEARLHRIAAAINCNLWGVQTLAWNRDALAASVLQADRMSLIFQDGEIYDAPAADALPAAIDLSALPISEQSFTFYAALPTLQAHGGNLSRAGKTGNGMRYVQVAAETQDLFSDSVTIEVSFLRKTVYLLSHLEPRDSHICFPVVRIRRIPSGGFEIDYSFMPPSVSIGAVPGLALALENLLSRLNLKIGTLQSRRRQLNDIAFEIHSGDTASFWMLNMIGTAAAPLAHCARHRQQHPERLFEHLLALAGGLMAFSKQYALADLPAYHHDDISPSFEKLDTIIRALLDTVISSRYFTIPLEMDGRKTTHHRGTFDTTKIGHGAALYLAVNADMPALELVAAVPLRFKVASPDDIERIVGLSLPGVELIHMPQVPSALPIRPNTHYFTFENRNSLYETMLKEESIAIYVPAGIKGLKLELFALTA